MDSRRFTAIRAAGGALLPVVVILAIAPPAAAKSAGVASSNGATMRSTSCPAGAPVQAITIVESVGAGVRAITRLERALAGQAVQLHHWWRTPCVTFAPGGWQLRLVRASPGCEGRAGCHCPPVGLAPECASNGEPYATVVTFGARLLSQPVSMEISHEMLEMLADPGDDGREVCDPVEDGSYRVDGVWVSDFATPAWFTDGRGPFDESRLVDHAHQRF
jgi:hypothetical protein